MMDWSSIAEEVLRKSEHEEVIVDKQLVPHPTQTTFFKRSLGIPRGQIADYRMKLKDGRSLHIVEFKDHYRIHWDIHDPEENPLGHLLTDSPKWLSSIILAGALIPAGFLAIGKAVQNLINSSTLENLIKAQRALFMKNLI